MSSVDFGPLADSYKTFRSGYSEALVDAVMGFGALAGGPVIDVGCGTGIATQAFAAKGALMTGLDPSPAMLAHARTALPTARFEQGKGEAIPFADNVFRGAICAQAMHWMDAPRALAEMSRVVRSGGVVATWWKALAHDDDVHAFRAAAARSLGLTADKSTVIPNGFTAFYATPFAHRELRVLPHAIRPTVRQWIGYETSRANANAQYGERRAAYFAALEAEMVSALGSLESPLYVRYTQYLYVGFVA